MKDPTQLRVRIDWIDYAKGIGIFFVVLGHVLRGLSGSVGLADLSRLQAIDAWIYSFHMPLFFFLSGLFSKISEAKNTQRFLIDKLRNIVYPYVVWSGIIGVSRAASGKSGENLLEFITNFWRIIYQPIDIFWFLYTLFLISTFYFLLRKLGIVPVHILFGTVFIYTFYLLIPQLFIWSPLEKIAIYSTYFVIGAVVSNWLLNQTHSSNTFLSIAGIFGFIILFAATYFNFSTSKEPNLFLGTLGITSCLLLAKLFYQLDWLRFFKDWGGLSLQIYVAHTAVTSLTRSILQKEFHVDELFIHAVLGTAVGIYFPILLDWIIQKIKLPYLFTIPRKVNITDKQKRY
jgi:fucose 4-O-acetylase-like acetyltransferase